ncbi:MAG: DUF4382 domain-containing protein [Bacteroidota bacterium]
MNILKGYLLVAMCILLFAHCEKENNNNETTANGNLRLEMTDAPSDDANIRGVFVTIAEVKVDGKTFEGFNGKKTIDVKAYQNGKVEALGLGALETGTYSNITVVLDYDTDANGNAPGCYVLTANNQKEALASASASATQEIKSTGTFVINENDETDIVLDFDLRKAVRYENQEQQDYSFATQAELSSAVRLVEKEKSGHVKGNCDDNVSNSEMIVVYAYTKGSYDKNSELSGQGNSNITFANAETSAAVDANGNYQLSFLTAGDYELVFASYEDEDNDGQFELKGTLQLNALTNLSLLGVSVEAQSETTIDVVVTGILPL